ncbi:hypothetical protein CFBP5875_01410 [Agrobacterium pusense]|jgi:hypothetical protein|uniref:hypothetical protein n=1 Tax=Agrobacterium pusense TaxID=648995 RepID=UPI0010BE9E8D|nr:hypothetical protein [Agrobacterium pusense]QCL83350.1 hypothetical protein CFBP5875_01410 [Agrobacterium pusense]
MDDTLKRYFIITDSIVSNIAVSHSELPLRVAVPEAVIIEANDQTAEVSIGWLYVGETFAPPPEPTGETP